MTVAFDLDPGVCTMYFLKLVGFAEPSLNLGLGINLYTNLGLGLNLTLGFGDIKRA